MSREGALARGRERQHEIEALLGQGATVELFGVRFVVLYADSCRALAAAPHGAKGDPKADGPGGDPRGG